MIKDRNIDPDANIAMSKLALGGTVFGERFYVDYRNGSDNFDGKAKNRAFKTLSKAHTNAASNNNDVIFIDGDSEVVETALIEWTKNRIHVIGDNGPAPAYGMGAGARVSVGVTTVATDTATLRNTGVRNTFTGVKFSNSNTKAEALHCLEEAGEYNRYIRCEVYKSSLLTTNLTAELLMNGDSSSFENCSFGDLVNERGGAAAERPNVKLDREIVAGKVCRDGIFVDCRFLHKAAHVDACFFYGHGATDVERSLLLVRPIFWNSVLATAVIADAVNFGAAQTDGEVLLLNPAGMQITAVAGASLNIYVQNAPDGTTSGIAEEIAA